MHLAPGDPTAFFADPNKPESSSPEEIARLREQLGLDDPLHLQYIKWLSNTLQGNWGFSLINRKSVTAEIRERLPNTLLLGAFALVLAMVISVPVGILSAIKKYTLFDYVVTGATFIGVSIPSFWFALLLMQVFSNQLGWLPAVGMRTLREELTGWAATVDVLKHLILPGIVLSMSSMASWTRYQRSSLLEVIGQDYMRTARAKGLRERLVILRHALKNSLIPMITLWGMSLPHLVSGAFIIETVFAWPGMGRLGVGSIISRDYPVVMAVTMVASLVVVTGNFLADLAYAWADPRIRYE
jgi:peptide/nickel transport system permease protein